MWTGNPSLCVLMPVRRTPNTSSQLGWHYTSISQCLVELTGEHPYKSNAHQAGIRSKQLCEKIRNQNHFNEYREIVQSSKTGGS